MFHDNASLRDAAVESARDPSRSRSVRELASALSRRLEWSAGSGSSSGSPGPVLTGSSLIADSPDARGKVVHRVTLYLKDKDEKEEAEVEEKSDDDPNVTDAPFCRVVLCSYNRTSI